VFRDSARELKLLRSQMLVAMFAAMQVIAMSPLLTIKQPTQNFSFSFVFQAATGMLFGPVAAAMQGAVVDVVQWLVFPTGPYFPGFTLTAVLSGCVYGCFFYRTRVSWIRALCAKGLVNLFLNSGLNTLWIVILYNRAVGVILPARIGKNMLFLLLEVPLLVVACTALERVRRRPYL